MTYEAVANRYDGAKFRRTGRSGLTLPLLSLGLWHNFGDSTPLERQRAMLRTAFDHGVTHFDLANNYGPPYGSAETNFGHIFREDFRPYRDELIVSTKAGWDMWPGPYGQGGGSRKYVLASLDQSLRRMGLDYVDIFYSHRFDATTPLEETAGALATAVQQGKALYVGVSSYSAGKTREMAKLLAEWKVPLLIHQPSYNMFNRWIEGGLIEACDEVGAGIIVFTALAQGLLTDRYLNGIPADARKLGTADRRKPRRSEKPLLQRRRAGRDRQVCRRGRHQPLGEAVDRPGSRAGQVHRRLSRRRFRGSAAGKTPRARRKASPRSSARRAGGRSPGRASCRDAHGRRRTTGFRGAAPGR
jgi:L-glyceraldehyde 3-phosphate reductase